MARSDRGYANPICQLHLSIKLDLLKNASFSDFQTDLKLTLESNLVTIESIFLFFLRLRSLGVNDLFLLTISNGQP